MQIRIHSIGGKSRQCESEEDFGRFAGQWTSDSWLRKTHIRDLTAVGVLTGFDTWILMFAHLVAHVITEQPNKTMGDTER